MIVIFSGLPGAGKSFKLARTATEVLYRNLFFYRKQLKAFEKGKLEAPPEKRKLWSNLRFSEEVEEEFPGFIEYWSDPYQLTPLRDVDVCWDEIATHLDATQWQNMSLELKRWLQQHRKFGIEVYGTTQDFAQIDKSMRRLTSDLLYLSKLFGSRDKSATLPEVKKVWGLCAVRTLDPTAYDEETSKFAGEGFPAFMWLDKKGTEIFDTRQEIKQGEYPPMRHIARSCERHDCQVTKIIHA